MQWYYSKNAVQMGPVPEAELRAKIASGEITATDLVWREGMGDWKPVSAVPELGASAGGPPAVPSQYSGGNSPYHTPSASYAPGLHIPNYLWQSIVVTIFCCWPLGIPAIVYAAKVDSLRAGGDINGAMDASSKAKMWCWIAAGAWLVIIVIYLLFFAVFGFLAGSNS
jgi:hypothetical protein